MGKHYTKTELELYRNHQMSVLGRISCAAHLKACPECAKLLEELKADDELVKELRASVLVYSELMKTSLSNTGTRQK